MIAFSPNRLLQALPEPERRLLLGRCEPVNVPARFRLEEPSRDIGYVYFLESGLAALLYLGRGEQQVDVGLVGAEGCTGCSVILGLRRTPQGITMQVEGRAQRIPTPALHELLNERKVLQSHLLSYVHTVIIQRDETALAASRGTLLERLARLLLMAQDRLDHPELRLTHDVLALMLGVRRAGVTTTLAHLRQRNLVTATRGAITILNRDGLRDIAGVYYGGPEAEYDRLFGCAARTEAV